MAGTKSALVFGASGVTGWATVNEILNDYPKKGIWGRCHALTNRPLSREQSYWPDDPRLNIVSGIDLLKGSQEELEKTIKDKIPDIDQVTHVIYLAYKAQPNIPVELEENVSMFKRAITALDHLSPSSLEFVVLQTGAKHYGCHLLENCPQASPEKTGISVPLKEDMPRLPPPYDASLFYYPQLDWLSSYSSGKSWSWSDPRPDIIIGFVPNQNFYSLGSSMGIFLSLYREKFGPGAECPFPGTSKSWVAKSQDSSSDMIARQTIHTMLLPQSSSSGKGKGEAYNVADYRQPKTWSEKWPVLCSYFGLKGVKLDQDNPLEMRKFIKENLATWAVMEEKYGLQRGHADSERIFPGFEYFLMTQFDFDRQYDMGKMYDQAGFTEERDTRQAWGGVFDRMKGAGIIPKEFTT